MTVATDDARTGPYSGDGSTTVFSYDFLVLDEAHLVVTLQDSDGVETVQTLGSDYTVSGVGDSNGGSITMSTAPASGEKLTITRDTDIDQEVDLQNRGSFFPATIERSFDKLTLIAQEISDRLTRLVKLPVSESGDLTLPILSERAGKFLSFDANGEIETVASSGSSPSKTESITHTSGSSNANAVNLRDELDRRYVTPQMFGAAGDGSTNDTQAFEDAAAASLFVLVPYSASGYNVDSSVSVGGSTFLFAGGFVKAQLAGTASLHDVNGISYNAAQHLLHRLRIEPPRDNLTGSNEDSQYGLFVTQSQPDLSSTDYGTGFWAFNELNTVWRGRRDGSGGIGTSGSATVHGFQLNMTTGGPDLDLVSIKAIGCGLSIDMDDTSNSDRVGINGGVRVAASTPGKSYGGSSSVSVVDGGSTAQAVGYETDLFVQGTGTCDYVIGLHAWSGVENEPANRFSAYGVGASGAASALPWNTGVTLYTKDGTTTQPIATDGSWMEADIAMTLQHMFNLPNVTVTGNILDFPNATLTGAGVLTLRNGGGVNFSAVTESSGTGVTVNSRQTSNYERGTWTPSLTDGTNTLASGDYDVQFGSFQIDNAVVKAWGRIQINSKGSLSGALFIDGLPRAVSGNLRAPVNIGDAAALSLGSAGQSVSGYVDNGTNRIRLRVWDATSGTSSLGASEITASTQLSFEVSYPYT